jgi:hypothetical protein
MAMKTAHRHIYYKKGDLNLDITAKPNILEVDNDVGPSLLNYSGITKSASLNFA